MTSEFWAEAYPREISGALFRMELSIKEIHLWVSGEESPRTIKVSEIQMVTPLADGATKIAVQYHKDVIVPTRDAESERVCRALNALLGERYAVEERDANNMADS